MKGQLIIILLLLLTVSCKPKPEPEKTSIPAAAPQVHLKIDAQSKPFSNPALICGSSFAQFFSILYRTNRFGEMLRFSASGSIKRFGRGPLREFYRNKCNMDFNIGKLTAIEQVNDTFNLIYSRAMIAGTRRKIVLKVVVESDSCRIVLSSLNNPWKYLPD